MTSASNLFATSSAEATVGYDKVFVTSPSPGSACKFALRLCCLCDDRQHTLETVCACCGSHHAGTLIQSCRRSEETPASEMMALPIPPSNDRKRVKVYELRDNDWFDRGTGFCTGQILDVRIFAHLPLPYLLCWVPQWSQVVLGLAPLLWPHRGNPNADIKFHTG